MDLEYFKEWVYKEFRIDLKAYKPNQLHRRILSLMSRVGVKTVEEYIQLLKKDKEQKQKFLDFITINVSEFFRNPEIFNDLKEKIKVELLPKNKNLKIWSAACSIGAEPYSIAMILDEIAPTGKHSIIATDLDNTILDRAKRGQYVESEIKNVTKENIQKYFKKNGEFYEIDDKIKNMVTFKKHDLILDKYDTGFDLIVCRNVVIYFNQDVKDEIYKKFSQSLKKDALLFVGATESIYNYKDFGFDKASTFIYRKI
ncbi:chemotaxis protein methyltransferase CheR [Clostridium tetanomorphum]|uniref:protein-glutamate O-methyltransferase n=1 Tax=Clostridium tetanomorphum TaxID=1553 RepID=A0A923EB43_CLOTT|nr:protein-glutamate O-methyltransferase CheR [Clostridium tetanomorphum]KAJ53489.1 chemotaxis protein CheR [Clostridium tetanomorphum DSM 665]MBC2398436.1 protein-glutamate O-methyltransferase CheR [Clostridium tetanomorphum]MBP1865278.1 chemotaxis protein methyltransferase CheR [Clostridium tetanomorphum]NRS85201.1 chemotaxis protein methyltransferase CheR [Clostridium tetanomorphum]NRZ98380.1 chemotaxis protein methyltransferase CheR [Clostridium tetanomorphum]